MSTLLTLHAPVPATRLVFEDTFFGEYNALIRLTQQRHAAAAAAAALDADDATSVGEHVEALRTYARAWRTFAAESIYDRGSSARSRLPLEFEWRVALVSGDAREEARDASPLLETACSTLAYVAALQRSGAVDATGAGLEEAVDELVWLRERVLEPLLLARIEPPLTASAEVPSLAVVRATLDGACRREPSALSAVLCSALEHAIRAQGIVKRAVAHMQASTASASTMASLLFAAHSSFTRAHALLPTCALVSSAQRSVSALAHRYTAEALLATSADDATRGVAVAIARAGTRTDPTNVAVERYSRELDERNTIEFGMQTVPSWESIAIHIARDDDDDDTAAVRASRRVDGWDVYVPAADGDKKR